MQNSHLLLSEPSLIIKKILQEIVTRVTEMRHYPTIRQLSCGKGL